MLPATASDIAVTMLPATAALPAVAMDPATAVLATVAAELITPALATVAADPATAVLATVDTDPATAVLATVDTDPATAVLAAVAVESTRVLSRDLTMSFILRQRQPGVLSLSTMFLLDEQPDTVANPAAELRQPPHVRVPSPRQPGCMTTIQNPRTAAAEVARTPTLPTGADETVTGFGVMGLPFASGHYLAFRDFPAASFLPGSAATGRCGTATPTGRGRFTPPPPQSRAARATSARPPPTRPSSARST